MAPARDDGWMDAATYRLTAAWLTDIREGPARAYRALSDVFDDPLVQRRLLVLDPTAATFLVRVAVAAGELARANAVADCAALLVRENEGYPTVAASALQARGLLDENASMLQEAVAAHRHPWARASALEDLGVVLTGADGPTARAALEAAASSYDSAGAHCDGSRVVARLRALATGCKGSRRARPVEGWQSLTDGERKVADLVADGLTNRDVARKLFVSRHTVDFHLRSIYRKLNVHSRVQLARVFTDRLQRW
jgi:DNA-binding CsgD family transcriptional regulator